jgi:RimJ/RimL family protein N-acetyltransferase
VLTIRALVDSDIEEFIRFRREALAESPLAFTASPEDDLALDGSALRARVGRGADWVIICAFDGQLVACAGLIRNRHLKAAHKMHLWGMYVAPSHRGQGIAAAVLEAAKAHARSIPGVNWIQLAAGSPQARRAYERAGFRPWGVEPDAMRHNGISVDETWMAVRL